MLGLQKKYVSVLRGALHSYGGSQMWSERETIRRCGCGPVAAMDLSLYLQGKNTPIPLPEYERELQRLCKTYFPLLPPFGINGISFVIGINRLFKDLHLPYHAVWAASGRRLWSRIEEMLADDLPVIMSVGPNFPVFWGKDRLSFYSPGSNEAMRPVTSTHSHYVTATGIDDQWLRISSWGREYYINRKEYEQYARRSSNYLLSNIVYLKKKQETP